jgi:hypothetical protein
MGRAPRSGRPSKAIRPGQQPQRRQAGRVRRAPGPLARWPANAAGQPLRLAPDQLHRPPPASSRWPRKLARSLRQVVVHAAASSSSVMPINRRSASGPAMLTIACRLEPSALLGAAAAACAARTTSLQVRVGKQAVERVQYPIVAVRLRAQSWGPRASGDGLDNLPVEAASVRLTRRLI